MKKARDSRFELIRIISILLIIFYHITLYSGITLLMLLLLPTTTIFFTLNILIGIVVMVLNTYIILPIITYVFNNWHNMYRIRVRRIQLATDKNNLDKIDEELIDSININTRKYEKD